MSNKKILAVTPHDGTPKYWFFETEESDAYNEALNFAASLSSPFDASCTTWQTVDYCQFFCNVEYRALTI